MRSTQIVLYLVLLNVSMGIVAAAFGGAAGVAPEVGGDAAIEDTADQAENVNASRSGLDDFVGGVFAAGGVIENIRTIVFFGPEMLRNLGAPGLMVDGLQTVVVFVVAFDVVEVVSGRSFS